MLQERKNHGKYEIRTENDLYVLQYDLIRRNSGSKIKWAARELANNIIEYNETGHISVNGRMVMAAIDADTMSEKGKSVIEDTVKNIENKTTAFDPSVRSKNNYQCGGLGYISIFKMGFRYRIMKIKDKFIIICKLKKELT